MTEQKQAVQQQRSGNWLKCPVCGCERFFCREGMLNTRVMAFIDLEWVNPKCDCYICENCRHILWFFGENEKI